MSNGRYVLTPAAGLTPGIGLCLSAMNEVREQLREIVEELTDEQLARRAVPGAHAIGELLLHIGEAEWWWMQRIVMGRELTEEARKQVHWDVLKDPEVFGSGYSAQYCMEVLDRIREETKRVLAAITDADLERIFHHVRPGETDEISLRWILHHLVDHESQHKGQILLLKRLLGEA